MTKFTVYLNNPSGVHVSGYLLTKSGKVTTNHEHALSWINACDAHAWIKDFGIEESTSVKPGVLTAYVCTVEQ